MTIRLALGVDPRTSTACEKTLYISYAQVFVCVPAYVYVTHCAHTHTFASVESSCSCSDNGARTNEISMAEEMRFFFFFSPGKSLCRETGSGTEVIASVRLLLSFTVLHHLDATLTRYNTI